jgi:hypothetical protein
MVGIGTTEMLLDPIIPIKRFVAFSFSESLEIINRDNFKVVRLKEL